MSSTFQTAAAFILVALAATWLVSRALVKKKNPGCGGDCGCPTGEFKAKLKH
jgi:hypothetical protein